MCDEGLLALCGSGILERSIWSCALPPVTPLYCLGILAGYRPNLLALEISGTLGSDNIEALKGEIESTLRLCHGLEVLKIAAAAETWEVNPMVAALVVSRYLDHLFPQAGEIHFVVNSNDEAAKEWWVGISTTMKTFTMIRALKSSHLRRKKKHPQKLWSSNL